MKGPTSMRPDTRDRLVAILRQAADEASSALSKWLGRATTITVKDVAEVPIGEAAVALGSGDEVLCVCAMHVEGDMPGVLALATSDASGLALADLLLGRPAGTAVEWGDLERSAAAETTNIIGCAYLNAVATQAAAGSAESRLIPSPPWFVRDYPESVMGSIAMTQASATDGVFLTKTVFGVEGTAIRCSLVFVPQSVAAQAGGFEDSPR